MFPTFDAAAFEAALRARAAETESALEAVLPMAPGPEGRVDSAMRYCALGGGKRLRAFLTLETAALLGANPTGAARAAAAVELLHAYSLAHDDLPSMDDDDMRRGRPTAHLEYDEATAVLAGDALQTRAFEVLAAPQTHPDAEIRARLVLELAQAAGAQGMVGGQMIDIIAEEEAERGAAPQDLAAIERLQDLKTGALIRCSAVFGAVLAEADEAKIEALRRYAGALGRAFQIRDDLLDHEGDEAEAGKRLRKDDAAGKATFVGALGLEAARKRAQQLVDEAKGALTGFGDKATLLAWAADFAVNRAR